MMAEQELSLRAALEYADSRRVFTDVNSRVMVVLADAVRGLGDVADAAEARAARSEMVNGDET